MDPKYDGTKVSTPMSFELGRPNLDGWWPYMCPTYPYKKKIIAQTICAHINFELGDYCQNRAKIEVYP